MALGALEDDSGNDSYEAGSLAQGAGTANGMGFLLDGGGPEPLLPHRERLGTGPCRTRSARTVVPDRR